MSESGRGISVGDMELTLWIMGGSGIMHQIDHQSKISGITMKASFPYRTTLSSPVE